MSIACFFVAILHQYYLYKGEYSSVKILKSVYHPTQYGVVCWLHYKWDTQVINQKLYFSFFFQNLLTILLHLDIADYIKRTFLVEANRRFCANTKTNMNLKIRVIVCTLFVIISCGEHVVRGDDKNITRLLNNQVIICVF